MNVGVKNVDPIIRTVLSNIAGMTVDRLPKYTTTVEMLPEMKALAYKQIAEKLQVSQQLTLHSDGTSKFGQHYGSFQVSTTESSYSLGLGEMLCGSAQCTLDTLKLILSEIDVVAGEGSGNTILANIKNTCPIGTLWRTLMRYLRAIAVKFFHPLLRGGVISHQMSKHESVT